MANNSPPVHSQFKPGVVSNPGGRPKLPDDIKEARKVSQFEFERIVNRYLFIPPAEIKEDLERKDATAFEHLLGGIIHKAIVKRDERKAEWLLSRTLGKMRERLEIESKSLRVNVQAQSVLPTLEQLALENPDLSSSQLSSFADKLERIREELKESKRFAEELELPLPLEAASGE